MHAYSGGLDKVLKMYDFNTSTGNYRSGFIRVICMHRKTASWCCSSLFEWDDYTNWQRVCLQSGGNHLMFGWSKEMVLYSLQWQWTAEWALSIFCIKLIQEVTKFWTLKGIWRWCSSHWIWVCYRKSVPQYDRSHFFSFFFFFGGGTFYNCIVPMPVGFLQWVAFPRESQLRQSCATQPTVHAGCFSVSIFLQTLTWTTGSLTYARM